MSFLFYRSFVYNSIFQAKQYTKRNGVVVLENAYHGTTIATVGLSPTKSVGRGGTPLPDNVRVAMVPDTYRGIYGRDQPNAGPLYAIDVKKQIDSLSKSGYSIAALFCESIQGVGGQVKHSFIHFNTLLFIHFLHFLSLSSTLFICS